MKYLLIKNGNIDGFRQGGGSMTIIEDPITMFKSGEFNEETDVLYQIGNQVKLKISIEPTEVYRTTVHKRDLVGLKDDLGVGEYRG